MNLVALKRKIIHHYMNSKGWTTDRKIIVIESDDWGSIRMPSKEVYELMLSKGFPVDKISYLKYDSLESNSDLEQLFDVLTSFKDKNGNHPVITANTIISNPDFEKIRTSNFKEYHSELFTETLKRYPEHNRVLDLYRQGISKKIFYPQLHGMEHVNVSRWMESLQKGNTNLKLAFDLSFFDLSQNDTVISEDSFVDALHPTTVQDIKFHQERLFLAADAFENLFGFRSKSFIAPCYIWNDKHETIFKRMGVELIQCGIFQLLPKIGKFNKFKKRLHYTGESNRINQKYSVRNCSFEPSISNSSSIVEDCLLQVEHSFLNKKPAIISAHRLNFIGFLDFKNRVRNLELLGNLLDAILKKWPDVEFLTSEDINNMLK